tara:strand:- start:2091 stop:2426 length:336 start_codon:yes stop_codon:yes gene_type:complete
MRIEKYTVEKDEILENAISKILIGSLRTIFVVDKKRVIGTISEGDILRSLLKEKNLNSPVTGVMNKSFKFITGKKKNDIAKKIFKQFNIGVVPVLNKKNQLIDIILMRDLI